MPAHRCHSGLVVRNRRGGTAGKARGVGEAPDEAGLTITGDRAALDAALAVRLTP